MPPEPPPPQEQVIEQRLVECGLEASGFTVKYEDYLQSIEIVIHLEAGATVDDFGCIKQAAGYEIVTFTNSEMYRDFMDYESELARPQMLEMSRAELATRGLLEGFPNPTDFENLDEYAVALEMHVGFKPGSALTVTGDSILIQPPMDEFAAFSERNLNLMSAVSFASARYRIQFYFVGNENFRVEPYEGQ